jgi:hypothetical protein
MRLFIGCRKHGKGIFVAFKMHKSGILQGWRKGGQMIVGAKQLFKAARKRGWKTGELIVAAIKYTETARTNHRKGCQAIVTTL